MMAFTKKAWIALVSLLIFSCSSYKITKISILTPGQVHFPPEVQDLSLVLLKNEFNMPSGRLDSLNNIRLDPEFNYYQFAREYLYGLLNTLQESPRFDNIVITDLNKFDSFGNEPAFYWEEIIRICRNDSTDAVILIDDFYLDDSLKVTDWGGAYYVRYLLKNRMYYLVLNPKMQEITGRYYVLNEFTWDGLDLSFEAATGQLPDPSDMILLSCYETGQKAGRSIAPVWSDDIRRIYYTRGNRLLAKGALYAKSDTWREAAGYWRMAADSKKNRTSARAAFNMALVCEIEDRLDLAQDWIALSDSLRRTEFSVLYQQILQTRMEHKIMLDKQMGFQE